MQRLQIFFKIGLVLGTLFFFTGHATAIKDYKADELKKLIDSGATIFLLNPLSEIEFNEAHIKGSVNIPIEKLYETKELPKDKDIKIVTYCKGPKCPLSKQAAIILKNRFYSDVATFIGGLPAWEKAGYPLIKGRSVSSNKVPEISAAEFKKMVGWACIIDIRTPKLYGVDDSIEKFGPEANKLPLKYKKKYLLKIPMSKLSEQYHRIPADRKIVVMDHRGKQANVAARYLISKRYDKVCVLKGGISSVPE